MARYRKIDPRIWNDEKFREMSDKGKLVFFMLLTHPHMTSLGAMRATLPGLAAELGWQSEAFREAFLEASVRGLVRHDEKACLVWLPRFLRYNPPESPNVIKAWVGADELLPECNLKLQVIQCARDFAEGLGEAFHKAFPKAWLKTMPNQEQEQEQEQEKKEEGEKRSPTVVPPVAPSTDKSKVEKRKGTKLPSDFQVPDDWIQDAIDAMRCSRHVAAEDAFSFVHYFTNGKGKNEAHVDWMMTWRNWYRKPYSCCAKETNEPSNGLGYRSSNAGRSVAEPRDWV